MASVSLGNWTKSFNLHSGSGSTNWRGFVSGPRNVFQSYSLPAIPAYGTSGESKVAIVAMGMDLGGYNEAGDFRFKIWRGAADSNGNYPTLFYSDRLRTANNGTDTDVTRKTVDFVSKTHDSTVADNPETHDPPVLTTSTTATTNFKWGFYSTSGYTTSFQEQANTAYNVYRDNTGGTWPSSLSGVFDIQTTDTDKTLIGRIYYVYIPSPPTINSVSAGVRSVTVDVAGSSDNGGDPDGMNYVIQVSTSSTFSTIAGEISYAGAGTSTISGLQNNTTYYTRVFASNTASIYMLESSNPSVWGSTVTTPPLPNWSTGETVIAEEAVINTYYQETFNATSADSYAVVGGSLPPGISLTTVSGYGVLYGTPTTVGSYSFTVRAVNAVGTADQGFSIEIIGGAQVRTSTGAWIKGTVNVRSSGSWVPGTINVYTDGAWKALG